MIDESFLLREIEMDKQNLQQLLNRLPLSESKGEYRSTQAAMKILVKEIHNTRVLLENKIWYAEETVVLPLFECEPSPIQGLEKYKEIDSFFGSIE